MAATLDNSYDRFRTSARNRAASPTCERLRTSPYSRLVEAEAALLAAMGIQAS